jgi:ADP-ribose pyrophosphatase
MTNSTETIATGRYVSLVKVGRWEYATRTNASGVVFVAALTDDEKLIFVEQFRPPVAKRVIEFPAGLAGDVAGEEHESLEQAAARELEEETGYRAAQWQHAFTGPATAGLCDEIATLFLARGLTRVGAGGGVEHEAITVYEVPLLEVDAWLQQKQREGSLVDGRVYAGLYFLARGQA